MCIYVYISLHICMYMYSHRYVYIYMCMSIYIYICSDGESGRHGQKPNTDLRLARIRNRESAFGWLCRKCMDSGPTANGRGPARLQIELSRRDNRQGLPFSRLTFFYPSATGGQQQGTTNICLFWDMHGSLCCFLG